MMPVLLVSTSSQTIAGNVGEDHPNPLPRQKAPMHAPIAARICGNFAALLPARRGERKC